MSYIIDQIIKNRTITAYLASKGIYPVGGIYGGKLKFCCPIHKEKHPSFTVYLNGEFENYFCFGCKHKYNIIHLYKALENVSTGDAIRALSGGLDLNIDAEINYVVKEIEEDNKLKSSNNVAESSLIIARLVNDFLKKVDNNPADSASSEKIFQLVDEAVDKMDLDGLEKLQKILPDVLLSKAMIYEQEKEKRICTVIS